MNPQELKYTKEHEWVKINGDIAEIGITDHAQSALGDITFIELPAEGKNVKASESIATIESVKAASDIYSPVTGEIIEVNNTLEDSPENINGAPYGEGWICRVKIEEEPSDELMDAAAYEEYLKTL